MTVMEISAMNAIQNINRKLPDVTLRDLFAMSVMPTLLKNFSSYDDESIKSMARRSYIIADAMLEARKK